MAARCTMTNEDDHTVAIGPTGKDEMCNLYIMYWVEGDNLLDSKMCWAAGPPAAYWSDFRDAYGRHLLQHAPASASQPVAGDPQPSEHHHMAGMQSKH